MGSLFSGGGGWEIGAMSLGIVPKWSVEKDAAIAAVLDANMPAGHVTHVASVEDVNPAALPRVDLLVASPPCQGHSIARGSHALTERTDTDVGIHIIRFLDVLRPKAVLIENVIAYRSHRSFLSVVDAAREMGYVTDGAQMYSANDYGTPSSRRRMFCRFVYRRTLPPPPERVPSKTWLQSLAGVPLEPSALAPWQRDRLNRAALHGRKMLFPLLVSGNHASTPQHDAGGVVVVSRNADEPAWTVAASYAAMSTTRVVTADRRVFVVPVRGFARFQGFPDTYKLPENSVLACKVIGNAVPPPMAAAMIQSVL